MGIETEMMSDGRHVAAAARTSAGSERDNDVRQRAEAEFLRKVVADLQPMLRQVMRSRRTVLTSDARGSVALKSDGVFVHVDIADQEDVLLPLQVLYAEPDLLKILNVIEAEVGASAGLNVEADVDVANVSDVLHLARHSLVVANGDR